MTSASKEAAAGVEVGFTGGSALAAGTGGHHSFLENEQKHPVAVVLGQDISVEEQLREKKSSGKKKSPKGRYSKVSSGSQSASKLNSSPKNNNPANSY